METMQRVRPFLSRVISLTGDGFPGKIETPSAPMFDQLGQDSMELQDDNLCVICLDNPRTCGFVHGTRYSDSAKELLTEGCVLLL